MRLIIAALAATLLATPAGAVTGNYLRDSCMSYNAADVNYCAGYLLGAAEMMQAANGTVCISNGTTGAQFRAVFLRFVESRPQDWNRNAQILVAAAFEAAWPCEHGGKGA